MEDDRWAVQGGGWVRRRLSGRKFHCHTLKRKWFAFYFVMRVLCWYTFNLRQVPWWDLSRIHRVPGKVTWQRSNLHIVHWNRIQFNWIADNAHLINLTLNYNLKIKSNVLIMINNFSTRNFTRRGSKLSLPHVTPWSWCWANGRVVASLKKIFKAVEFWESDPERTLPTGQVDSILLRAGDSRTMSTQSDRYRVVLQILENTFGQLFPVRCNRTMQFTRECTP